MLKEKEKLQRNKCRKISQLMTKYIDDFDKLSKSENFTIDEIEKLLSDLNVQSQEIYNETSNELINQLNERKMIQLKKKNMSKKELN